MEDKKKRKNYFSNQGNDQKKRKRLTLECGMRGFFCTCNFREKDCVREAFNLLNEYTEKLHESDKNLKESEPEPTDNQKDSNEEVIKIKKEEESTESKSEEEDENEDISSALNKEINELKAEAVKSPLEKKFQVVDTGVSNVIFIKTTVTNTLEFVTSIIKDLHETKKQKTRYLLRMLPVQVSCKAYLDDIKSKADTLFEKYFSKEPKSFCIVFNRHCNSNLHRNDVIQDLAQIISKKNPGNKANLKNPDIAVVLEVIRAVCLISIAPHYFMYKKYNLLEICHQNKSAE